MSVLLVFRWLNSNQLRRSCGEFVIESVWTEMWEIAPLFAYCVLILQKWPLRLIYFAQGREHAIPFFLKGKLLPLEFLYFEKVANLMYDVRSVLMNMSNLFSKISRVHSYSTRSLPSEHFYTKQSALNIQGKGQPRPQGKALGTRLGKGFSRVGVYNWNEIPINLKSLPKNSFNISIKENYSKFNYSRS